MADCVGCLDDAELTVILLDGLKLDCCVECSGVVLSNNAEVGVFKVIVIKTGDEVAPHMYRERTH